VNRIISLRAATTVLMSAALVLGGCKTMDKVAGGGSSSTQQASAQLTPAEKQMRKDEERFNKTVIGGVVTGAVVGGVGAGVFAKILGGDSKDVKKAVAGGVVAGAAIGGIDGYNKAKREQSANNELRAVQAAAADVRADNTRLQALIDSSSTVLAEGKTRLETLRREVAAKRVSADQASQARKREEANIESMQKALAKAKETREQYAQSATKFSGTPADKRDLDAEISRMGQQVAALEKNISDYNQALIVSRA
jgi:uncharacterized protein YcfJ